MSRVLLCKRGDTIQIDGTRTDPATGDAVSLSGVTVASEIERNGTRHELTTEVLDASAGTYRLTLDAATSATLAVGIWLSDTEFVAGDGTVISTDTYSLNVQADVTNAG